MIKKKEYHSEDNKTWEEYIKNPTDIYDKESTVSKNYRKERYRFDLHGYTLDNANDKVEEIIKYCVKNKFKELLLITGKGIHSTNEKNAYTSKDFGKLKFSVPEFIKTRTELKKFVLSINEAEKKEGGEGAIIIKLRNL